MNLIGSKLYIQAQIYTYLIPVMFGDMSPGEFLPHCFLGFNKLVGKFKLCLDLFKSAGFLIQTLLLRRVQQFSLSLRSGFQLTCLIHSRAGSNEHFGTAFLPHFYLSRATWCCHHAIQQILYSSFWRPCLNSLNIHHSLSRCSNNSISVSSLEDIHFVRGVSSRLPSSFKVFKFWSRSCL